MEKQYKTCFLHVDLDAFFASVEQLDNPDFRGKPLIVGGLPGEPRSVVSTASYEARKFGVHSAMPISQAYRLCPNGIFVHGRMKRYLEMSEIIMNVFKDFSPEVEQMSIDEAFVDLTGTEMLFGNPFDTAMTIKKRIKEKTSLTVSVGIAQTKYIAKIASGLNKPDGITEILPGTEEDFILSLPLEKIWGIGDKTRKRINSAGLKTTKDIHQKSKQLLCMLFGNSTGNFLYDTVHGLDNGAFTSEVKSHSLSAEHTFSYDVTDIYTAETYLLELSQTVMFRLLKEKLTGKTVVLKLRYDDFSTITAQNSFGNVTSTDELFDRAKNLFQKHWERGRGIRLLGIAVANVEDAESQQGELFDDTNKKTQAVEKAILNLNEKHPEIKVSRARLLKKAKVVLAFVLLSAFSGIKNNLYSAESISASGAGSIVTGETPSLEPTDSDGYLFTYGFGKNDLAVNASGFWQAEFASTSEISFGNETKSAFSFGVPVFKQKVDLTVEALFNNKYFFQSSFADEFTKNTIAAGYRDENSYVREIKIANREIIFPLGYSLDLFGRGIGGGKNQAPGISAHFEDAKKNKWYADAVFRYDIVAQREATYYGSSSLTKKNLALSAYIKGQQFVIPSSAVSNVSEIYIESVAGNYTDTSGRTYERLSQDDFLLLPSRQQIIISKESSKSSVNGKLPQIVVTFSGGAENIVHASLGDYTTTGYLHELQSYFGKDISAYSFASTNGTNVSDSNFFTIINNRNALIIQSPAGFSPFAVSSRYDLGIENGVSDADIVSQITETVSQSYEVIFVDNDSTFYSTDFFSSTHVYADVARINKTGNDLFDFMFPFAKSSPGIYLGYGDEEQNILQVRTSVPVNRYDIGTEADAGSVRVYINNVIDSGAKYDAESGTVTLSRSVSDTDKIYITWNEDAAASNSGAIATALGFGYKFKDNFFTDASVAVFWPVAPNRKFADSFTTSKGFATLAAGVTYNNDTWENVKKVGNFSITDAVAFSLDSENTLGKYRLFGMDYETPTTYYLGEHDGRNVPSDIEVIMNPRPNDAISPNPLLLPPNLNRSQQINNGISVYGISGYAIPIEWNGMGTENEWSAAQIILNSGNLLARGTEFSMAIQLSSPLTKDVDVYLQLGVNTDENEKGETADKIPTWKLYDGLRGTAGKDVISPIAYTNTQWQQIKVAIKDEDRAHLTSNYGARIIVVRNSNSPGINYSSGRILVGPYETAVKPIFVSNDSAITVTTPQFRADDVPDSSTFNDNSNYAQAIVWHVDTEPSPKTEDTTMISAARYFKEIDFSAYETVNFAFSYTPENKPNPPSPAEADEEAFSIVFDQDAENINSEGNITLRATITKGEFYEQVISKLPSINFTRMPETTTHSWHKFSVNLQSRKIYIDGNEIKSKAFVNVANVPSRMKLKITVAPAGTSVQTQNTNGMFCFDEIHLDGASLSFDFQNITKASYKKDGTILRTGKVNIFEDFYANATASEKVSVKTKSGATDTNINANGSVGMTLFSVRIEADAMLENKSEKPLTSAGHNITTPSPLFNVLSFTENYRYNYSDKSLEKMNKAAISFSKFKVPLAISGETKSKETTGTMRQNATANFKLDFDEKAWNTFFSVQADVSQRVSSRIKGFSPAVDNYFSGWLESSELAFSGGNKDASVRTVGGEIKTGISLPVISLSPQIIFDTKGNYSNSSSPLFNDSTSFKFIIPFVVKSHSFSLEWNKTGRGNESAVAGGNYGKDYNELFSNLGERQWFFTAFPFYDLFSTKMSDTILSNTNTQNISTDTSDSLAYNTTYSATWKRPIFASLSDLFVPASASLSFARDIHTAAKISDLYHIKLNTQFTAFNILGSQSAHNIFKWYEQDEFITSLTLGLKIPRHEPSSATVTLDAYTQTLFYLTDSDVLQLGLEFNSETKTNIGGRFSLAWKRAGKLNPLANLASLIYKKYEKQNASITRTNSVDIAISYSPKILSQSYSVAHKAESKLFAFFAVTYGIEGKVMIATNTATKIAVLLNIGGKLSF